MHGLLRHTREALVARRRLWRAGRILAREGDGAAAEALWRLNRRAKRLPRAQREVIYSLKTPTVRVLHGRYGATEGAQVRIQEKDLPCWGDRWEPCGPGCYRCDGTGVYRTLRFYVFTLFIRGRRYRWHQPDRFVDWPVEVTGEPEPYAGGEGGPEDEPLYPVAAAFQDLAVVYRFLIEAGVKASALPSLPRLRAAVRADVREALRAAWIHSPIGIWWYDGRLPIRARRWWRELREWRRPVAVPSSTYEDDDDLPF